MLEHRVLHGAISALAITLIALGSQNLSEWLNAPEYTSYIVVSAGFALGLGMLLKIVIRAARLSKKLDGIEAMTLGKVMFPGQVCLYRNSSGNLILKCYGREEVSYSREEMRGKPFLPNSVFTMALKIATDCNNEPKQLSDEKLKAYKTVLRLTEFFNYYDARRKLQNSENGKKQLITQKELEARLLNHQLTGLIN